MTEDEFMRSQAELAWDSMQLAQIAELQNVMADYATRAWRPIETIPPPTDAPLLCVAEEGVVIMVKNNMGDWRTNLGTPHKAPTHWMPCPVPPRGGNGRRSLIAIQGGKRR